MELIEDEEEFVGYDQTTAEIKIARYRNKTERKGFFHWFLTLHPSMQRVVERCILESNGQKTAIVDTKKENNLIIHFANELPADPKASFRAVVNTQKVT